MKMTMKIASLLLGVMPHLIMKMKMMAADGKESRALALWTLMLQEKPEGFERGVSRERERVWSRDTTSW